MFQGIDLGDPSAAFDHELSEQSDNDAEKPPQPEEEISNKAAEVGIAVVVRIFWFYKFKLFCTQMQPISKHFFNLIYD